ncbi:MAG: hypothetical protein H7838_01175 [Magnetococcus sp. DMHC-8]
MLLLAVLLPVQVATAREQAVCPVSEQAVQVEVRFAPAQPFVDDSQSAAWIQNAARALHHPIGLTVSRLAHTLTAHFEVRATANRRARCVHLRSVSLELGYPNTKIYIADGYPPGGCAYQAIHRHEMEHVRILNAHQENALPAWRTRLQALARAQAQRPLLSENPQQAQQQILHEMEAGVQKEIRQLDKAQKAAQAAIDTPQSYADVRASCRKW